MDTTVKMYAILWYVFFSFSNNVPHGMLQKKIPPKKAIRICKFWLSDIILKISFTSFLSFSKIY